VEVPTLDGSTLVTLPPGTQTGDEIRLADLGVPYLKGRGRGAEVVTTFVRTPEKLSKQERRLLEELRASLPPAEVARRNTSLWDRVREKFH
jgi:molecular chaperone DnaJ